MARVFCDYRVNNTEVPRKDRGSVDGIINLLQMKL